MFCSKKCDKIFDSMKRDSTYHFTSLVVGMVLGAAATAAICAVKKMRQKGECLSSAISKKCDCDGTNNTYENFCECNGDPDDHERARNGFFCHSDAEECDTDILHSHGCLGYPHDNYCGFANSNGDRPSDPSSPEIDNQKGIPEGNTSPYWEKNAQGKGNPQPENKVNEVKRKK